MDFLDLNHLNFISPYSLWKVGDGYNFKTDYGVVYRISFDLNQDIWENGAYEFGIQNENMQPSPNDVKVKQTIKCIIEEFFVLHPDILLYQCETGDRRQSVRQRLFYRWFQECADQTKFVLKVSSLEAEGVVNYIAMIVEKNNPSLVSLMQDFDNFIGFFSKKPE